VSTEGWCRGVGLSGRCQFEHQCIDYGRETLYRRLNSISICIYTARGLSEGSVWKQPNEAIRTVPPTNKQGIKTQLRLAPTM
jgi:hypothetical protein